MDWRKNLYHYEEQPPEHVWNKVSEEISEDAPASLREGLYTYSETPPAAAWENINTELGWEEKPVRVLWPSGSWKIASAAAAACLLLGLFYFNRDAGAPKVAASVIQPVTPATPAATPDPASTITEPAPIVEERPAEVVPSTSSVTVTSTTKARRSSPDRNYIYFTSSKGDQRRLSYKLEKLLPAIRNKKKNEMVDEWTSALERSSFVPSGNNFFDIVELVKMVDEKQD